jgi:pSer/pThr/pTyr-binding forkhead associated (FHA) protein
MRTVTIGTDPACDIVVDDPYASPVHCRLTEGRFCVWVVQDLGSTNGTTVMRNGQIRDRLGLGATCHLTTGDVLVIGRTRMPPFTPERVAG